jgi:hypothetical protein
LPEKKLWITIEAMPRLVNYALLEEVLTGFEAVQVALSLENQFRDTRETAVKLDCFAYNLSRQEQRTYAKFLELFNTGIFQLLPYSAYHR